MASDIFHQLYYHLTWSVKGRRPGITAELRPSVEHAVAEHVQAKGGTPIACSAMPDHVHLVLCLPPTACLEVLVPFVKGNTATDLNRDRGTREPLWWDAGYGAVTIRKGELDRVVAYVANQVEIHAGHKASRTLEAASQSHYEALGAAAGAEQAGPASSPDVGGPDEAPGHAGPQSAAAAAAPPPSRERLPRARRNGGSGTSLEPADPLPSDDTGG